ncbi:hypothetical protein C8R47DRAFT_291810 [Mycena vitilis]|nr:hypothetical protein C8R47DRAFT_291810 [Mycena vitilis]
MFSLFVKSAQERLQPLLRSLPLPTLSPMSAATLTVLDGRLRNEISNERDVDKFMDTILESVASLMKDLTGAKTKLFYDLPTTDGVAPKVVQEIVVNVEGVTHLTVEDKTPAVGQKHFTVLVSQSMEPGGWIVPPVMECKKEHGRANLAGAASIISKLSYCLTDDLNPHSYALLHDARCLHLLVKRNARYPSFFISPPIVLDDPHLFHVIAHLFLWDPPSSLEAGYDPPAEPPLATVTTSLAHPADSGDTFVGFAHVFHRCENRPHKSSLIKMVHCTENIDSIVITSFDDAPSRATVMRGLLGSNPVVIKVVEHDRGDDLKTEAATGARPRRGPKVLRGRVDLL